MAATTSVRVASPSYQAYEVLHIAYTIAPLVAGIDKFFHFLTNWDGYLAPIVTNTLHVPAHTLMLCVGAVEIVAAFIVAFAPRIGSWIVGLWLCGIIINLLLIPGYFDIALRDFGLALGAFALARLSVEYSRY
jgi:hypothetical protein